MRPEQLQAINKTLAETLECWRGETGIEQESSIAKEKKSHDKEKAIEIILKAHSTQSKSLSLSDLKLDSLPEGLFHFFLDLQELDISHIECRKKLPESIFELRELKELDISYYVGFSGTEEAENLIIHEQFENLINHLGDIGKIKSLGIAGWNLKSFPAELYKCKLLEELNIGDNKISKFPEIAKFEQLKELGFDSNQVSEIDEVVFASRMAKNNNLVEQRKGMLPKLHIELENNPICEEAEKSKKIYSLGLKSRLIIDGLEQQDLQTLSGDFSVLNVDNSGIKSGSEQRNPKTETEASDVSNLAEEVGKKRKR
jgi:Leucine-rich repeat (LRR) protein